MTLVPSPLSHLAIAESSYDGPIPPAVLATAIAADRIRKTRALVRIGRVTVKPELVVERMARVLAARLANGEDSVTESDLTRAGFTEEQIRTHRAAATRRLQELLAGAA